MKNKRKSKYDDIWTLDYTLSFMPEYIKTAREKSSFNGFCRYLEDFNSPSDTWFRKRYNKELSEIIAENRNRILEKEFLRKNYDGILGPCLEALKSFNSKYSEEDICLDPYFERKLDDMLFEETKINKLLKWIRARVNSGEIFTLAIDHISGVWLLRSEGASLNDFIDYFENGRYRTHSDSGYEKNVKINNPRQAKGALYLLSLIGNENSDADAVYTRLWDYTQNEINKFYPSEKLTENRFMSIFVVIYNNYLSKAEVSKKKKIYLKTLNKKDLLLGYKKKCEERQIPPDIFWIEQNYVSPKCVAGDKKSSEDYMESYISEWGYEALNDKQRAWLKKIQQKWANQYTKFKKEDFEDVDKFKFIGRKVDWYKDPNVPYQEFTKYCVEIVSKYKEETQMLPVCDKSKALWERGQLDYAVKNLKSILASPNIYPLEPEYVDQIEKLLIDVYMLWKWSGERECAKYLIEKGYHVTPQYKIEDCRYKKVLPFDIKAERDGKWFLVEFDGEQHYEYPNWVHKTREEYEEQQKRDQIKNEYCKNNNICLIRVKKEDLSNLDEALLKRIS